MASLHDEDNNIILDKLSGTKGKKYAIVIDEAHSSTSGRNIMALKESLTQEEALEVASQEEADEVDAEDKMYYNVNKKIEDDPSFDKGKATKSIIRYVSLHSWMELLKNMIKTKNSMERYFKMMILGQN